MKHSPPDGARGKVRPSQRSRPILKSAMVAAAEIHGADGEGKDGLVGFFHQMALSHPEVYVRFLERISRIQHNLKTNGPVHRNIKYETRDELREEFKRRGLPLTALFSERPNEFCADFWKVVNDENGKPVDESAPHLRTLK